MQSTAHGPPDLYIEHLSKAEVHFLSPRICLRVFVGAILSARYCLRAVVGAQLSCAFLSMNHYNKYAAEKKFQAGEQVVVLDKDSTHKTFSRWQLGTIARVRSPYSDDVEMTDGSTRHLHANKIRKFIARVQGVGVVNQQDEDF